MRFGVTDSWNSRQHPDPASDLLALNLLLTTRHSRGSTCRSRVNAGFFYSRATFEAVKSETIHPPLHIASDFGVPHVGDHSGSGILRMRRSAWASYNGISWTLYFRRRSDYFQTPAFAIAETKVGKSRGGLPSTASTSPETCASLLLAMSW